MSPLKSSWNAEVSVPVHLLWESQPVWTHPRTHAHRVSGMLTWQTTQSCIDSTAQHNPHNTTRPSLHQQHPHARLVHYHKHTGLLFRNTDLNTQPVSVSEHHTLSTYQHHLQGQQQIQHTPHSLCLYQHQTQDYEIVNTHHTGHYSVNTSRYNASCTSCKQCLHSIILTLMPPGTRDDCCVLMVLLPK